MARKKTYKTAASLPKKEDGRVQAPDADHINDPAYIEFRQKRAEKRRPAHVT